MSEVAVRVNEAELGIYTSMKGGSRDDGIAIFNAMQDSVPVNEFLDEVINLRHYVAEEVSFERIDPQTGEVTAEPAIRIYLIDENGRSFTATSETLLQSLKILFKLIGDPENWDSPTPVIISEKRSQSDAKRRFFTLRVAS